MIEFSEFQKIVAKQLRKSDPEAILPEMKIKKDLGADSLDILQLLLRLEDEYGLTIPDEQLAGFETVGDVYNFISTL